MLLETCRWIFSFLDEANHSLSAVLIESIKIVIFDISKVIRVLLESGLFCDGPWLSFVVLILSWHQSVLKIGNKSYSWFKLDNKWLLESDVPCASDSPRWFSIKVAILPMPWALDCKDIVLISYFNLPDVLFGYVKLIGVCDQLNFIWKLMAANLLGFVKIDRLGVGGWMECPDTADVVHITSCLWTLYRLVSQWWSC